MRAVIQRAARCSVTVDGDVLATFDGPSLVVLVGVTHTDTPAQAKAVATKVAGLRILDGERSVLDDGAPVLLVSQFTLYGDVRKGRRPSWTAAAPGAVAEPLVDAVADELRALGVTVGTGQFGAHMQVELVNDGPVTIVYDADA
ncbi:D-aminoacyl-tRNA deacylase [Sanguibacter sp. A247]|uniref:D-aminoacyl-tRNA deacylase n=1 Tax=unclassified Sanguibacter TaxID=2645534 RepID=UPI003FD89F76